MLQAAQELQIEVPRSKVLCSKDATYSRNRVSYGRLGSLRLETIKVEKEGPKITVCLISRTSISVIYTSAFSPKYRLSAVSGPWTLVMRL